MTQAACRSRDRRLRLPGLLLLCFSLQIFSVSASQVFYTTSNDAADNQLIRFRSGADGAMAEAGRFATGGLGTGRNLPAANSIALSQDRKWLLVVTPWVESNLATSLCANTQILEMDF